MNKTMNLKKNRWTTTFALLSVFFLLPFSRAAAQELIVTVDSVGQLGTRLPDSLRFSMSELKITGPLGGSDIKILLNMLKNPRKKKANDKVLTVIDLSEASIVESRGSFHTKADVLPANMFQGCKNLEHVILPSTTTEVSMGCFSGCVSLTEVDIPEGTLVINKSAFSGCASLKELKLPATVTTIKSHAFDGCTSLSDIDIPDAVELIDEDAFANCKSLVRLNLHNTSIKAVKAECFARCERLETISLPSTVTVIGNEAFKGCTALESI